MGESSLAKAEGNGPQRNSDAAARCVRCGAGVPARQMFCGVCRVPESPRTTFSPPQFALDSLFLVVTLVAGCLAVLVALPPLGAAVIVIVAPSLVRAMVHCHRLFEENRRITRADKIGAFVASLALAVLAIGASLAVGGIVVWLGVASYKGLEALMPGVVTQTTVALVFGITLLLALIGCCLTFFRIFWWTLPPRANTGR